MTFERRRIHAASALKIVATLTLAAASIPTTAWAQSSADEARQHYRAGAEFVRSGNCRDAIPEFRRSLDLLDSPNTRLLYARCLGQTGDVVSALAEYERTQRDAVARAAQEPRYASTGDVARDEGTQLAARIGRIVIRLPAGIRADSVRVGGREVTAWDSPDGIPVLPGRVSVEVSWHGTVRTVDTDVAAGRRNEVSVDVGQVASPSSAPAVETSSEPSSAPPVTTTESPHASGPTWVGFAIGGLGVAGLAAGAGLYGAAWGEYTANMNRCNAACTDQQLAPGRGMELGAYISFGVGGALVVGGVIAVIVLRRAPSTVRAVIQPTGDGLVLRF